MKNPKVPAQSSVALPPVGADTLAAIGPVARSSVVDAVADRLQSEILSGRLAAGSRLPSERELSLALGVNRLTLRAALARLEALGLVATRHGAGTLVTSWRERAGLDTLATLLASLSPEEPAYRELLVSLLEVRTVLVAEAVALAAERHVEADLVRLRQLAAEQPSRLHDAVAFARGEIAFQRMVIRAGKNVGLELVLNTFARIPDEHPLLVARIYDRPQDSIMLYEVLIGLIASGQPESARNAVRDGLAAIDTAWLDRQGLAAPKKKKSKGGA
jgi:GntR family transcriptional repressor for pyruvate dehydrogenase complex